MNRNRVVRPVVAAMVLAAVLGGACKKKTAYEPSRLLGNTFSGQSVQTVERRLSLRGGDWNVIQDQRSLVGQPGPPSRLYIISKPGFEAYGTTGDVVLTFFNDELVSARFYPPDVHAACAQVEREQQITLCDAGEARIMPNTRVWIGKDDEGKQYLGWIDKQRQAALENWNTNRK